MAAIGWTHHRLWTQRLRPSLDQTAAASTIAGPIVDAAEKASHANFTMQHSQLAAEHFKVPQSLPEKLDLPVCADIFEV